MIRIITLVLLFFASQAVAEEPTPSAIAPTSLAALANAADVVVLAQARDTDYFERREIPVSGSAYLKVLIPYKGSQAVGDIIEVYEKGLHPHECYFPNVTVFEEGRRYLLFLKKDPALDEDRYRGLPEGCALDVLVDSNNRYALRYPVTGITLSDALEPLATDMSFSDSYAIVDDETLLPEQRDAMLAAGEIIEYQPEEITSDEETAHWKPASEAVGRQWIYTRGVSLTEARKLIGAENLSN